MEKEKSKTLIDKVWDLFASVKLAVVIFGMIALTSMVGTVLEQNAEPEKNLKILAKMFGPQAAPSVYEVLDKLGFMDMYHSWWFVTFLLLFAANLVICSFDRLPRILKIAGEPIRPLTLDHIEKMSIKRVVTLKGGTDGAKEVASSALTAIGFKPQQSSGDKSWQFYAERGNFTRLGVYVTHLSILIILAGAIIGLFFGFNGWLPIQEGEVSSVAYKEHEKKIPLGFDIRCDKFQVDYYGQSDMPKAYKSWLSILKDGKVVKQKAIVVNDPLTYDGITFYQSSFGPAPDGIYRGVFIFNAVSRDGQSRQVEARMGDTFTMPGTNIEGTIKNFSPSLAFQQDGTPFTYEPNLTNPAVLVEFHGLGEKPTAGWIMKRDPRTWNLPDGSRLELQDLWGFQYTGLQVRKDPGVLIVYFGCILMALGLYVSFFMSHRRVWIYLAEEKGNTKITVGASAHRNRAAFERKIEKLVGIMGPAGKGEKK